MKTVWMIARAVGAVIILLVAGLYLTAYWHGLQGRPPEKSLAVPQFVAEVKAGQIKHLTIYSDGEMRGYNTDRTFAFRTMVPTGYAKVYEVLDEHGVNFVAAHRRTDWMSFLAGAAFMWVFMALRTTYNALMTMADRKKRSG